MLRINASSNRCEFPIHNRMRYAGMIRNALKLNVSLAVDSAAVLINFSSVAVELLVGKRQTRLDAHKRHIGCIKMLHGLHLNSLLFRKKYS